MHKQVIIHILLGTIPVVLFFLMLDPFMYWMPVSVVPILLALAIVAITLFVGLVWREVPQDERESYHVQLAARVAYTAGLSVLAIGCAYQALTNMIDPWLYAALVVMVVSKLIGRVYAAYQS